MLMRCRRVANKSRRTWVEVPFESTSSLWLEPLASSMRLVPLACRICVFLRALTLYCTLYEPIHSKCLVCISSSMHCIHKSLNTHGPCTAFMKMKCTTSH